MAGRGGRMIMGVNETKLKNLAVAGGLSLFVGSVYLYTMKAVGGSDDLQVALETFEREKSASSQAASGPT